MGEIRKRTVYREYSCTTNGNRSLLKVSQVTDCHFTAHSAELERKAHVKVLCRVRLALPMKYALRFRKISRLTSLCILCTLAVSILVSGLFCGADAQQPAAAPAETVPQLPQHES